MSPSERGWISVRRDENRLHSVPGANFKRGGYAVGGPDEPDVHEHDIRLLLGCELDCRESSGRVYLAKASSLISSKRDKEEAGGRLSDLVCCIEFDRGSAMLRTERGA